VRPAFDTTWCCSEQQVAAPGKVVHAAAASDRLRDDQAIRTRIGHAMLPTASTICTCTSAAESTQLDGRKDVAVV
jgi:hypothetical protein